MRTIEIDGTWNTRAIGPRSAPWLLRSAALDELTPAGSAALDDLGVTTVIDLREVVEHAAAGPESAGSAGTRVTRSLPLYGTPAGPPSTGSLETIYDSLLRTRGAALAEAVGIIADAQGAVLVHCTAGKDRTGLVVALALLAVDAEPADVVADYALSGTVVAERRRDLVEEALAATVLTSAERADALRLHLDSPAEAMVHALAILDEFGGPLAYLLRHGVTIEQLGALRARVLERDVDDDRGTEDAAA